VFIAFPKENPVHPGAGIAPRIARHKILDFAIVVSQHYHGNIQPGAADFAGQLRRVHVPHRKVGHDQIELLIMAGQVKRFGATGNVCDPGM
jgi:hypothetical protein